MIKMKKKKEVCSFGGSWPISETIRIVRGKSLIRTNTNEVKDFLIKLSFNSRQDLYDVTLQDISNLRSETTSSPFESSC